MTTGYLRAGAVFSVLSGILVLTSSYFGIMYGLPCSFDAFRENIEMAGQVVLYASLGIFSQILIFLMIIFGYSYAIPSSSLKERAGVLIAAFGAILNSMSLWFLLESTRLTLRIYSNPPAAAIPGMLHVAESGFLGFAALSPLGAFLLYGGSIGILASLLTKGGRPKPVIGMSLLTAVLGVLSIGLYTPEPIVEVFRVLSMSSTIVFAVLAIILGVVLFSEAVKSGERSGTHGLKMAIFAGLLGVISVLVYILFLQNTVSFVRTDLVIDGWYNADLIGIGFYAAVTVSLLLGVMGIFGITERLQLNQSRLSRLATWIIAVGYGVILTSVGLMTTILLIARNGVVWFYSVYWPAVGEVVTSVTRDIMLFSRCGIAICSLGVFMLAFTVVRSHNPTAVTAIVSITAIGLLFAVGLLLTQSDGEFPGIAVLTSGLLLSVFGVSMGLVLRNELKEKSTQQPNEAQNTSQANQEDRSQ